MRVVAGWLGGRTFDSPHSRKTHPMSDKIRGALFNSLGDISGLTVYDPFTGSGAISIEAISRGAKSVVALDLDKAAFLTASNNVKLLGISDRVEVYRANAGSWSRRNAKLQFDLVIADPPFDSVDRVLLAKIAALCKVEGIVVLSLPPIEDIVMLPENFEFLHKKTHGDAELWFYRRVS